MSREQVLVVCRSCQSVRHVRWPCPPGTPSIVYPADATGYLLCSMNPVPPFCGCRTGSDIPLAAWHTPESSFVAERPDRGHHFARLSNAALVTCRAKHVAQGLQLPRCHARGCRTRLGIGSWVYHAEPATFLVISQGPSQDESRKK